MRDQYINDFSAINRPGLLRHDVNQLANRFYESGDITVIR